MKHILIILKCPITNQGRMINFTNSLSKFHKLTIFSLYDGNTFESNSNIEHHTYQLKKNFLNKLLKSRLFIYQ